MSAPTPVSWRAVLVALAFLTASVVSAQRRSSWVTDVALDTGGIKLGGCAVGDVLPERRGREIVAVGKDGSVYVAYRDRGRWRSQLLHRAKGELIQVAVGDVDPDRKGDEIVAVGMAEGPERRRGKGAAILVYRDGDTWQGRELIGTEKLLHGVCIRDGAAFVIGFDKGVQRLWRSGGTWRREKIADLPAAGKSVLDTPFGLVIACTDGTLARVEPGPEGWKVAILDRREAGRARLGTDGRRILCSDDDGTLSVLVPAAAAGEAGFRRQEIFRADDRLRGAVLADLDPGRRGLEAATAGYDKRVTMLTPRNDRWRAQTLFEDKERLHHLVAGDVDGQPGLDLVACGFSGKLFVLRRGVQPVDGPQAGDWEVDVAIESQGGFGGCATGELLPDRPGEEIVAVAKDGSIHLAWWDPKAGSWQSEVVHRVQGELIQVTVGDVDPAHPGNEILGVGTEKGAERSGGPGAAVVVRRTEGGWRGEVVFVAKALLHGACVKGGHGFVTGYDRALHRLVRTEQGWRAEKLADLPGAGKSALATRHGIVVACTDGSLARVERSGGWKVRILDKRMSGRSRLGTDGHRIICSDNDGTLSILTPVTRADDGLPTGFVREEIHREFDLQRGAILADLDPTSPGLEAATAGYEYKISLLKQSGGRWWSRLLYRDTDRLHHMTAGDVDGKPGLELVACGYSGRVLVLRRIGR